MRMFKMFGNVRKSSVIIVGPLILQIIGIFMKVKFNSNLLFIENLMQKISKKF